jgi:hypothetical protein
MIHTFIRYTAAFLHWAKGEMAFRLTATVGGLLHDCMGDTARQIWRFSLPLYDTPVDALPMLLRHFGLPTYDETYAETITRLRDVWNTHQYAGAEVMLIAEAARCGITNPSIEIDTGPLGFWIKGDNVQGVMPKFGTFDYDDGTQWGYIADDPVHAKNVLAMMQYFKPAREYFRGLKTANWLPNLIPDCEYWARADMGVTIDVGVEDWQNQGDLGNSFDQSTDDHQPTFNALGFGGEDSITYDGNDDELIYNGTKADFKFLHDGTGGTFFAIIDSDDGVVFDTARFSTTTNIGFAVRITTTAGGRLHVYVNNGTGTRSVDQYVSYTLGTPSIVIVRISTGETDQYDVRLNGVQVMNGSFAAACSSADPTNLATIGTLAGGAFYDQDGELPEQGAYSRYISNAECDLLKDYADDRYILGL